MAPQREGGDEEESTARPKLATSLQGGSGSSNSGVVVIVGETACTKRPLEEGEARGEVIKEGSACEMDNELTNLTWLQNCNLLQGIQRSLTSDVSGDSSASSKTLLLASNNNNNNNKTTSGLNAGADEMYNPTVHRHAKPPFSFSCLIFMAIEDSPSKALPVKDNIRHNLSLSKCFYKVDKGQNLAKGSLWCVDPKYRHHLLHSLNKTPNAHYHQGVRLPTFNPPPPPPTPGNDVSLDLKETQEVTSPLPTNNTSSFQYAAKKMNVKNPEEDAAVTMLALKNGSVLTTPLVRSKVDTVPTVVRINAHDHLTSRINLEEHSRVSCQIIIPASLPVLTNVPSKDHTYSTTGESEEEEEEEPLELTTKPRRPPDPPKIRWEHPLSPILVSDFRKKRKLRTEPRHVRRKLLKRRGVREDYGVEEQKIVDGADALLNLAGILTGGGGSQKGGERPIRKQRKPSKIHLRHLVG